MGALSGTAGAAGPDAGTRRYPYGSSTFLSEEAHCEVGHVKEACFTAAADFDWSKTYDHAPLDAEQLRDQAALYARACEFGHAMGCVRLARHLALGWGLPRDVDRARKLATRACESRAEGWSNVDGQYYVVVGEGCVILSQLTEDPTHVRPLLERVCEVGYVGFKRVIYNVWMPGYPVYEGACGSPRLGQPSRARRRR